MLALNPREDTRVHRPDQILVGSQRCRGKRQHVWSGFDVGVVDLLAWRLQHWPARSRGWVSWIVSEGFWRVVARLCFAVQALGCAQVELNPRCLRRRPVVELQPGIGLLQEQAYRRGGRNAAAEEVMVQPRNVVLSDGTQFRRFTV